MIKFVVNYKFKKTFKILFSFCCFFFFFLLSAYGFEYIFLGRMLCCNRVSWGMRLGKRFRQIRPSARNSDAIG